MNLFKNHFREIHPTSLYYDFITKFLSDAEIEGNNVKSNSNVIVTACQSRIDKLMIFVREVPDFSFKIARNNHHLNQL